MAERNTFTPEAELITNPDELARREAENGLKQAARAVEIVRSYIKDKDRPFRLRQSMLLELHKVALDGIHPLSGTYRNTPAEIRGSRHQPTHEGLVADAVTDMCDYVNAHWDTSSALHLAAYVMWRLNWIHPFADGNGRTSRALSYVVLSIKLDSILPGSPTIPDLIDANKDPYYKGLEKADSVWKDSEVVDVSDLEDLLGGLLAKQLLAATDEAQAPSE